MFSCRLQPCPIGLKLIPPLAQLEAPPCSDDGSGETLWAVWDGIISSMTD